MKQRTRTQEEMYPLVEAYLEVRGTITIKEFSSSRGISEGVFTYWLTKYRRQVATREEFVEITPPSGTEAAHPVMEFLYPNVGSGDVVVLFPGVAYCFRRYHGIVSDIVQSAWLRFVRRLNAEALGVSQDLVSFMFDQERSNLSACRDLLKDLQHGQCFYCGKAIKGPGAVDHFVPWGRYPADHGHNFVLADATCNSQKSDRLASERHLESWVQRNHEHGDLLDSELRNTGLASSLATSVNIARWAYTQTAQLGSLVWLEKQKLVPLGKGWEAMLR